MGQAERDAYGVLIANRLSLQMGARSASGLWSIRPGTSRRGQNASNAAPGSSCTGRGDPLSRMPEGVGTMFTDDQWAIIIGGAFAIAVIVTVLAYILGWV